MHGVEPYGEEESASRCAIGGVAAPPSMENDVSGAGVVALLGVPGGVGICPYPGLQLVASANTLPDPNLLPRFGEVAQGDVAWKSEGKPKLLVGIAGTCGPRATGTGTAWTTGTGLGSSSTFTGTSTIFSMMTGWTTGWITGFS